MSKQTIKFQPIYPDLPTKNKGMQQARGKRQKPIELPQKIFLNNQAVGFIRLSPQISIFIKGNQLPARFQSLGTAKAYVINEISGLIKC